MPQGFTAVKTQKVSRKGEKIQTKSMKISNSSSDLSKQYRYKFLQSKHTAGEGKENKWEDTAITGRTNILVSSNKSLKDTEFFLTFRGDAVGKSRERLVKQLHHYASQLRLSINCLPPFTYLKQGFDAGIPNYYSWYSYNPEYFIWDYLSSDY